MKQCELCGQTFAQPRYRQNRFCSVTCRNRYLCIAHPKPRLKGVACQKCGKYRRGTTAPICEKCGGVRKIGPKIWTVEKTEYLRQHYANQGAACVAASLGLTPVQVRSKANVLRLTLSKEARERIVFARCREVMLTQNPMKREDVRQKVRDWRIQNPEAAESNLRKLTEGHQRIEREKPSGLEVKLRRILDEMGVDYEPSCIIKTSFIVDVRIGNLIIQADGDYWHGHPRLGAATPRQAAQQARDKAQDAYLHKCGYAVARIWESEMSKERVLAVLRENHVLSLTVE